MRDLLRAFAELPESIASTGGEVPAPWLLLGIAGAVVALRRAGRRRWFGAKPSQACAS